MVPYSALMDCDRSVVLVLDDRPDPQLWGHCRSTHSSSMICFFVFAVVSLWHPGDGRDVRKKPVPYNYLYIAAPDQPKSAFITHMGLFEFQRMPFGLCNAPGIFQRTMNKVLHGLVGKRCLVYLDDGGGGGKGVTSAWSPLGNFLEGQAHPNPSSN